MKYKHLIIAKMNFRLQRTKAHELFWRVDDM
jgi:hypothetical protein